MRATTTAASGTLRAPPVAKATNNTQEMAIPVDLVWARAEKWFSDHGLNIENSSAWCRSDDRQRGKLGRWSGVAGLRHHGVQGGAGQPNPQINLIITQSGNNNSVATVNVKGNTQPLLSSSPPASGYWPPSPRCVPRQPGTEPVLHPRQPILPGIMKTPLRNVFYGGQLCAHQGEGRDDARGSGVRSP